jgi:phosphoribosylformylglycinamidine synthase
VDGLKRHFDVDVQSVWHTEKSLPKSDAIILPGGFSYGDYLRGGSIASMSPIMSEVKSFVTAGGPVIGICNGFQVLTESGILPGVLLKNNSGRFRCSNERLVVSSDSQIRTASLKPVDELDIPVAHGEGNYFISAEGLIKLKDNGQILFRYKDNPNGSVDDIACITSENGRVWGMMPHPERAMDKLIGGSKDGLAIWKAFFEACL